MAESTDKLFHVALQLRQEDRAELVSRLINTLDPAEELRSEEAWVEELRRRTAEVEAGTAETILWETVKARLLASRG